MTEIIHKEELMLPEPDYFAPPRPATDLGFRQLRRANTKRAERWHDGKPWSGADWATAMAGEMGEACNVVKKLRRNEDGIAAPTDPPRTELLYNLGVELADTIIYADLLAQHYGIDLAQHVATKFNVVSDRMGFVERLPIPQGGN
jgi:NTP pyrophosphatase (non-canonical NTP hydrolase)